MNVLSWLLSLSVLILLMIEAVSFQRATVCRQEAWLKSTELITRGTLSKPPKESRDWHLGCKTSFFQSGTTVRWQRLPSLTKREFNLGIKGAL